MPHPTDRDTWIMELDTESLIFELRNRELPVDGSDFALRSRLSASFDYNIPILFNDVGRDPASLVGLKVQEFHLHIEDCIVRLRCSTETVTILPRARSLTRPRIYMDRDLKYALLQLNDPQKNPRRDMSLEVLEATLACCRRTVIPNKQIFGPFDDIDVNFFSTIGLRLTGMRELGYIFCYDPTNRLLDRAQFEPVVIMPPPTRSILLGL